MKTLKEKKLSMRRLNRRLRERAKRNRKIERAEAKVKQIVKDSDAKLTKLYIYIGELSEVSYL